MKGNRKCKVTPKDNTEFPPRNSNATIAGFLIINRNQLVSDWAFDKTGPDVGESGGRRTYAGGPNSFWKNACGLYKPLSI